MPDPDAEQSWVPKSDVFVSAAGDLVIKVELAAMSREHIELTIEGQRLSLIGRRADLDRENPNSKYLVEEIARGPFHLVVEVPLGFDLTLAKATYQNGLLRIDVPRTSFRRTSTN